MHSGVTGAGTWRGSRRGEIARPRDPALPARAYGRGLAVLAALTPPLPVRPSPPETVTYFITLRNTRAKDAAPQTKHRCFRSEARHSQTALGFKLELAQTHPDEPAPSRERLGRSVVSELHSCGGSSRANLGYEANHSLGRPQKHLLCVHCHMGQRPGGQELSAPRHVEAESDRDVVAVQLVRKNSGVRRSLSHSGAWSSLSPPGDSGTHSYDTK